MGIKIIKTDISLVYWATLKMILFKLQKISKKYPNCKKHIQNTRENNTLQSYFF